MTFRTPAGLRLGVKVAAGVLDVQAAAAALGDPALAQGLPARIEEVLQGGPAAVRTLAALVQAAEQATEAGQTGPAAPAGAGPLGLLPEAGLDLAPCVPNPGKIICVGLNYRTHAAESGLQPPSSPMLFSKFNNSLAGHGDPVPIPPDTEQMDYEAELAVVIGRRCRGVAREEALDCVFGYCNANDISARDLQFRTSQFLLGKTADGFAPIGPYLVTADEVADPNALGIRCYVNGELRQNANTRDMIFPVAELVAYISRYMTLEPGDLILTGTPEGVALGRPDKPWLRPGDQVTVEIDGLGQLTNTITAT